ncbi:hypothetical protein SAMN06265340_105149, partial [Desulfurobacterium atlanticum]
GMNGRTPFEVLKSKLDCLFNLNVACFPVVLLEDVFVVANRLGVLEKGGENVLTPYQKSAVEKFVYLRVGMLNDRWSNRVVNGFLEAKEEIQDMFSRRYS